MTTDTRSHVEYPPGSIWRTKSGQLWIVAEGGRFRHYPSMTLARLAPDLIGAVRLAVQAPP